MGIHGKNQYPERIMFNIEAQDVKREFDRIKKIGAKVIANPYNPSEEPSMMIATFSDPDGNFFQINSPMK